MDIGLFIVDRCIQLKIVDGDLAGDDGLETSVIISLMTDQRVTENELPPGLTSLRGWWGDMFPVVESDQIGSKLWLLGRAKALNTTLAGLENFATLALNWMLDDGVASAIAVAAVYDDSGQAIISIDIERPDGTNSKFDLFWDQQELKRA